MPGPMPNPNARRRNAPTIPTTNLPAAGRKGAAPRVPKGLELGTAGRTWWSWAWHTPQAAAWDTGALYFVARRAILEDDLAALELGEDIGEELLRMVGDVDLESHRDVADRLRWTLQGLTRAAGGTAGIMREMRELDNRLGLNPKALVELRWEIVDLEAAVASPAAPPAPSSPAPDEDVPDVGGARARLRSIAGGAS